MKKFILLLYLSFTLPLQAGTNAAVRQGSRLYAQEKYGQALSKYNRALQANPHDAQANFGVGAAAYHLKEYQQAATAFQAALENSEELRQDSLFNLGNTYYRANQKPQAIAAYKQAILNNLQDKEAIHNLQLILKEQQNQQNKNNQNNQNQDKNSSNQNQQDQQNNQGQAPQQAQQQEKQPQQPQTQQNQLDKQAADRVMQLARQNEYKHPTQPGQPQQDNTVEKDW